MRKDVTLIVWTVICEMAGCTASPPQAKLVPARVASGSVTVLDNYWWLRDRNDPAVIQYLQAENAYADSAMKSAARLQNRLYREMVGRIRETDETVPYRDGQWWYSEKTERGKQYPIYVRRQASPTAAPIVMIDVNQLAEGHPFFDYANGIVSDDGHLLAYTTDVTGNRQYQLKIKDLRSGHSLADTIPLVDSFAWADADAAIYYVREDNAKRAYRLYRHALATPLDTDELIYEETDEQYSIELAKTRDKKYLVLGSRSKTASEARVIPASQPAPPVLIEARRADREYYVDHRNNRFYIRTNDTGRNFRIVTAPDGHPHADAWSELVAARPDVVIEDIDAFAHHLVVTERRDGLPQLALSRLPDGDNDPAGGGVIRPAEIAFTEPDFSVALQDNAEFDPPAIRFSYTSLTTPDSLFALDPATGERTLLKERPVGGGFDRRKYREERLFASAEDGTKIPVSIVYRNDPPHQRHPGPMLLEGYGAYGSPEDVYFSSARLSVLDRGVTFAVAHVRGGGEYGRAWYDGGRMQNKPNTFSDFIAVAKMLERRGYTTPSQLAIEGGSAGGLLIGAVVNQSPELFAAAIADVPWVDVLADMSDATIPLTTLEYTEWGNPSVPAERAVIASYCPYTNVKPQRYPKMLVRESLNDSQVQYWDAARWVARLRAAKKSAGSAGGSELLLKMDMDAGHAGASGRYSELRDAAYDDAWLLTRLGIERPGK